MSLSVRKRIRQALEPLVRFFLMFEHSGAVGAFEDLHERLDQMHQRLVRLESAVAPPDSSGTPAALPPMPFSARQTE